MKRKKTYCSLCEQATDIYTTIYRTKPFIDGKLYQKLCFACYSVPKVIKQTYDSKGLIKDEIQLSYSCNNLHSAKELYLQGSAETLKEAKKSLESVEKSCKSCKKIIDYSKKPNPDWTIE